MNYIHQSIEKQREKRDYYKIIPLWNLRQKYPKVFYWSIKICASGEAGFILCGNQGVRTLPLRKVPNRYLERTQENGCINSLSSSLYLRYTSAFRSLLDHRQDLPLEKYERQVFEGFATHLYVFCKITDII